MSEIAAPKMRPITKAGLWFFGGAAVVTAILSPPDLAKERQEREIRQQQAVAAEQARVHKQKAAARAQRKAQIVSGEHCLSGWDGSFPRLKQAVQSTLRNPSSFEHIETARTSVDENGKFGLIMTYRAENGFGGMNIEAAGVEVDARSCEWRQVSADALARRIRE